MKTFFVTLTLATVAFGFAGCESDMPPNPRQDNPLQRGLRGDGQLIQTDPLDSDTPTGQLPPPPDDHQ